MPRRNRVVIIGLGLIGGSLGMALKRRRLARTVVGVSRKPATLRLARSRRAIDIGTRNLREAVRQADVVVLATPVDLIVPYAKQAARWMRSGSVLTDVGSVKGSIVRQLERTMPRGIAFVGAHPLAGSERRGLAAARPELFDGSVCVVTRTNRTNRRAIRIVTRLWRPLVRRVVTMDPLRHDRLLAAVSHVPHALAFSLVAATDGQALRLAPRSFLDATRVAKSDPDLWNDILFENRAALVAAMQSFERQWGALRTALAHRHRAAVRRLLVNAYAKRHALRDS